MQHEAYGLIHWGLLFSVM